MNNTIDTGDTVHHAPSDEDWLVACVQGDKLSWCGWPEGMAELSHCTLIKKASPEERLEMLREWAKPGDHEKSKDHRHWYAVNALKGEAK